MRPATWKILVLVDTLSSLISRHSPENGDLRVLIVVTTLFSTSVPLQCDRLLYNDFCLDS